MSTTQTILKILYDNKDRFVSSNFLITKTQISRIAIWQHIKKLKGSGYKIEAKRGIGYKLTHTPPDLLNAYEVEKLSNNKAIDNVVFFESTTSTMDEARKILENKENPTKTLVVALAQTQGRGRKNRHWVSYGDNIYASYIYKPQYLSPQDGLVVMFASCVAIVLALREINIEAKIKWPNDCIVNEKKISGVLVDIKSDMSLIEDLIIGFGVNINWQNIPDELNATSVYEFTKKITDRLWFLDRLMYYLGLLIKLIENGYKKNILKMWKLHEATLNRQVEILSDDKRIYGIAKDIDEYGFLLVETENGIEKIITCDSLRFL